MKILINFYASVTEGSINDLINFLTQQSATASQNGKQIEEIIIQISSSGGSSDHGLLAYNYLKQLNIPKTTIGMGNVDSAAVMIHAAGDKRLAMPSCRFLLHEALTTITNGIFNGTKLHEIASLNERITADYCEVIAKVTSKKVTHVKKKVKDGQVMSSEEAKKYGLIQEVIEKPYLENLAGLNIIMINNPQTPLPQKSGNQSNVED